MYDETRVVGRDYLKPVSGFFCRVCKKLLLTTEDSVQHMKTKAHWDLCVKAAKTACKPAAGGKRKAEADSSSTPSKVVKT